MLYVLMLIGIACQINPANGEQTCAQIKAAGVIYPTERACLRALSDRHEKDTQNGGALICVNVPLGREV